MYTPLASPHTRRSRGSSRRVAQHKKDQSRHSESSPLVGPRWRFWKAPEQGSRAEAGAPPPQIMRACRTPRGGSAYDCRVPQTLHVQLSFVTPTAHSQLRSIAASLLILISKSGIQRAHFPSYSGLHKQREPFLSRDYCATQRCLRRTELRQPATKQLIKRRRRRLSKSNHTHSYRNYIMPAELNGLPANGTHGVNGHANGLTNPTPAHPAFDSIPDVIQAFGMRPPPSSAATATLAPQSCTPSSMQLTNLPHQQMTNS